MSHSITLQLLVWCVVSRSSLACLTGLKAICWCSRLGVDHFVLELCVCACLATRWQHRIPMLYVHAFLWSLHKTHFLYTVPARLSLLTSCSSQSMCSRSAFFPDHCIPRNNSAAVEGGKWALGTNCSRIVPLAVAGCLTGELSYRPCRKTGAIHYKHH